jgi:hypothetical protein
LSSAERGREGRGRMRAERPGGENEFFWVGKFGKKKRILRDIWRGMKAIKRIISKKYEL